jgi:hypothetical protein
MHKNTMQDEITSLGPQLRLPLQAAPVDRAMMASVLAGDSGVQPSTAIGDIFTSVGSVFNSIGKVL